jgi:hypothetical protein
MTASLEAAAAAAAMPGPSDALSDRERWYAVHALPFAEARAECQLQRQGFRTFQPKRHKTVRHARKMRTVEAPFFPVLCSKRHYNKIAAGEVPILPYPDGRHLRHFRAAQEAGRAFG